MDQQSSGLAIRLEVKAGDERVSQQEGQDVIAVLALLGRSVNLDPVVEVEEPQRAGTLPDQRIEWREKRPRGNAARPAGVAVKVGVASPAGNLDRFEKARLEQQLDGRPGFIRGETEIIAQLLLRRDAQRRAARSTSARCASFSSGVGRARISGGMTRSVRS